MKKVIITFIIIAILLVLTGVWISNFDYSWRISELSEFAVILIISLFALVMAIRRIKSLKNGDPAEDEMSRNIMLRASSLSYYISIYLWLMIMYFSDKTELAMHTLVGIGILGMALILFTSWVIIKIVGLKHE